MAATCVVSKSGLGRFRRVDWSWTSHTDGTVAGGVGLSGTIIGRIVGFITNPGVAAPTDNYDITLLNSDGVDVLAAAGVDRDTLNSEQVNPAVPIPVDGTLELVIANAGSGKNGVFSIILEV